MMLAPTMASQLRHLLVRKCEPLQRAAIDQFPNGTNTTRPSARD
jgi:hypothetical protein